LIPIIHQFDKNSEEY